MTLKNRRGIVTLAAFAVLLAVVAAGCGGSSKKSAKAPVSTSSQSGTPSSGGKTYSLLRLTWDAPDYFDPALAYTVAAWQIMYNTYDGLLTYKHVAGPDGTKLVPDLAEAMPTVSSDGKTYSFTLRKGLKYSDGTPVKASDFTAVIERDYKANSPGVGFFSGIVGADAFGKSKKGGIPGIVTDDATGKITITLTKAQGDFQNILATMFATFVPPATPASDQSTKGIPGTGPYTITAYAPNRSFTIARNPNFTERPNVGKGNPDKVVAKIITDPVAAYQTVINGSSDYDFQVVPNDRLAEAQSKYKSQLKLYTPANTYYFFLNDKIPPFNNIKARQAVEYGIDRNAIVQLFGGLGIPTQNILPPTYAQYKKIDTYTFDLTKAKQLVKDSGTAGQSVDVYGINTDPSKATTQYLANQLQKIGYKPRLHLLSHGVYFTTVGNQATKAQAGYTDWYQDYPHPLDWFDVLFNGNRITPTHNNNYGDVNFPDVNQKIEKLKAEPNLTPSVNDQWATVDSDLVTKYAATVPFLNKEATDFFSSKMDTSGGCYVNHVLYQWDFSVSCQK